MNLIIGIDPGLAGGIAVLDQDGHIVSITKMPPTPAEIYDYLRDITLIPHDDIRCVMERVGQGMPGQSSKATATFARHCGHLEMALYALSIPAIEVTPQRWQKSLGIGTARGLDKTAWKNRLKSHAQMLFPSLWKAKKITLATADALLIARYGQVNK